MLIRVENIGPLIALFSTPQFLFPKQVQVCANFETHFHGKLNVGIVHGHLLLKMEVLIRASLMFFLLLTFYQM